MNPLSTARNKYSQNKKKNIIYTPSSICLFLLYILRQHVVKGISNCKDIIIDPAVGTGNLLEPFKNSFRDKIFTVGYDIRHEFDQHSIDIFYHMDFLKLIKQEEEIFIDKDRINLVVCNPPFNFRNELPEYKKKLYPELFAKKIFQLYGDNTPLVLFSPMGFRLNQRTFSRRWHYFRDNCKAEITSIISLPLDIFPNVEFHNEILIWNIPNLKAHYWFLQYD